MDEGGQGEAAVDVEEILARQNIENQKGISTEESAGGEGFHRGHINRCQVRLLAEILHKGLAGKRSCTKGRHRLDADQSFAVYPVV